MSSQFERDMLQRIAAQAADPATIAAGQKEHKRRQRDSTNYHTKHGRKLITDRREIVAGNIESFEAYLTDLKDQMNSLRDGLVEGLVSAAQARERFDALHIEREEVPDQIDTAVSDLEAVTELDPVESSRDFYSRFPALRNRIGRDIPELPSSNGDDSA
jgi:septal ring factor EnvC (AmiA/AmiB activator)